MLAGHQVLKLQIEFSRCPIGSLLVAIAFLSSSPDCARSEDVAVLLPKDGAWVRYRYQSTDYLGAEEKEMVATCGLKLVGTVVEDGVRCRWLESKFEIHDPPELARTQIIKTLVPEKALLESEHPLDDLRRMWTRIGDNPVQQVDVTGGQRHDESLLLWSPGMLKKSELLKDEAKDIEYQQGRLKDAQARAGEFSFQGAVRKGFARGKQFKTVTKYTIWTHPDLPMGFAEARIAIDSSLDSAPAGKSVAVFRLQDGGSDAVSDLPDSN